MGPYLSNYTLTHKISILYHFYYDLYHSVQNIPQPIPYLVSICLPFTFLINVNTLMSLICFFISYLKGRMSCVIIVFHLVDDSFVCLKSFYLLVLSSATRFLFFFDGGSGFFYALFPCISLIMLIVQIGKSFF